MLTVNHIVDGVEELTQHAAPWWRTTLVGQVPVCAISAEIQEAGTPQAHHSTVHWLSGKSGSGTSPTGLLGLCFRCTLNLSAEACASQPANQRPGICG